MVPVAPARAQEGEERHRKESVGPGIVAGSPPIGVLIHIIVRRPHDGPFWKRLVVGNRDVLSTIECLELVEEGNDVRVSELNQMTTR